MILGFLGKGGSGKTTLASGFALFLSKNNKVLAVDADHNMDMTYNLQTPPMEHYIGQGLEDVNKYIGVGSYRDTFYQDKDPEFSLSPMDAITEKYSLEVSPSLRVMSTGPHTDDILYDKSCSHILTTPLKVYLPFLKLNEKEYVVVDEKAGTDGVGTGVTTGFNAAVVVAEPTVHGLKAASQIIHLLKFYKTPYFLALNKVANKEADIAFCEQQLGRKPDFTFESHPDVLRFGNHVSELYEPHFEQLKKHLEVLQDDRKERTRNKYEAIQAHTS